MSYDKIVIKNMVFGARLHGFKSVIYYCLAGHITSLRLDLLLCEMGIEIVCGYIVFKRVPGMCKHYISALCLIIIIINCGSVRVVTVVVW